MPHHQQRVRKEHWSKALPPTLNRAREEVGLASDEVVPDEVLLAEVEQQFEPRDDLWPVREWFMRRLAGEANSAKQRQELLANVLAEAQSRRERGAAYTTFELLDVHKRDSPTAGA
jgi:hypothetical protein